MYSVESKSAFDADKRRHNSAMLSIVSEISQDIHTNNSPKSNEISTSTALRTVMILSDMERDLIYHLPCDRYDLEEVLPYLVWTSMNHDCCISANNDGSFRKLVVRPTSELSSLLNLYTSLTSSCFVKSLLSIVYLDRSDIHKARSHNLISIKYSFHDKMSQFSHVEVLEKRRHVSRTGKTSGASDISRDFSEVTPRKIHKWSLEEQVTLILLERTYENTWAEKRKIFNSYIQDELDSSDHFTEGALRTMYRELKNKFSCPFGEWSCIRKALRQKAALLCIALIDREASPPQIPSNNRFHQPPQTPLNSRLNQPPQTPLNSRLNQSNTGLPTPISNNKSFRQTRFPRLGFRAFDISNQGYLSIH